MEYQLTLHAIEQMEARNIAAALVDETLQKPQQVITGEAYTVYQSVFKFEAGIFLVRVFVNETAHPFKVITVYKTSKISKYYEGEV